MKSGILDKEYGRKRNSYKSISFRYKLRAIHVAYIVKKYLSKKNLNILDFGCAEGLTLLYMNQILERAKFTGLEYSSDLLSMSPQMPANITLQQADILELPEKYTKRKYDVVTAMAFFEHLQNPEIALKKAFQSLATNGLLVATFPNPTWDFIAEKTHLIKGGGHLANLTHKIFLEQLSNNGFELLEYKKFMWVFVAILPYLHIPVNEKFASSIDNCFCNTAILNMFMVNQLFVARKIG